MVISKSTNVKKDEKLESKEPKKDTIRMNINVSKSFYKKIKLRALDEDTTITNIVIQALKKYLGS